MKKTEYIILSIILLCFMSCETDRTGNAEWTDETLSEIRFPSGNTFSKGEDVIIICNGLSPDDSFYLVSPGGQQTVIEEVTVTASGIFFTANVPAGNYTVVVEHGGERRELGAITVTVATINVTISHVPSYCLPGDAFTVSGVGFDGSAVLVLEDADGNRTPLDTESSANELSAEIPENAPRGKLNLLIVQDDGEQTISRAFFVTSRKWLTAIRYTIGAGMASYEHEYDIHVTRSDDGMVTACTEYAMTVQPGSDGELGEYTVYGFDPVSDEYGYTDFELKVRDSRILEAVFETAQGGIEDYYGFGWEYSDGYLSYAVGTGTSYSTIFLETVDGNISLAEFYIDCAYDDPSLANNPFAADFTLGILAADNEILRMAQVLGLAGKASANLPSSIDGTEVSYSCDEEGYVTRASYTDPYTSFPTIIEYTYE